MEFDNPDNIIRPGTSNSEPASKIIEKQRQQNVESEQRYRSAQLSNLSIRQLFSDAGDAFRTSMCILLGNCSSSFSLRDLVASGNLLRGWGFILASVSLVILLIWAVSE